MLKQIKLIGVRQYVIVARRSTTLCFCTEICDRPCGMFKFSDEGV